MTEIWKPIVIDGQTLEYEISNHGNIRKGDVQPSLNMKDGQEIKYKFYLKDKKSKTKSIHVLVATEFLDNPNNYKCVKHKNGNVHDNRVENLEWISSSNIIKKTYEDKRINNGVPIEQYSEDGKEFIKRFNSALDASRELGICEKNFHAVLSGRTMTTGGFHFKYASIQPLNMDGFEKVKNHDGYMIDRTGQIYNAKQQVLMEPKLNGGFLFVYIERKRAFIHMLVATQFIANPDNLKRVTHVNGNKLDNNVSNLKWY